MIVQYLSRVWGAEMWPGANQGVPVQGGEEAAGLLDGPRLQVQRNFQNLLNPSINVECQNKLLLFSMAVAPVELSQETTTENSTLAAVEIAEEEEVDTFLQVTFPPQIYSCCVAKTL